MASDRYHQIIFRTGLSTPVSHLNIFLMKAVLTYLCHICLQLPHPNHYQLVVFPLVLKKVEVLQRFPCGGC